MVHVVQALRKGLSVFCVLFLVFILVAPLFFTQDFVQTGKNFSTNQVLSGASSQFYFGTDSLGRNLLPRVLHGAQVSLLIALVSAFVISILGFFIGAFLGSVDGRLSDFVFKVLEILDAIPTLLLLLWLKLIIDSSSFISGELESFYGLLLALCLTKWFGIARFVKIKVKKIRTESFVEAQKSLGANSFRVLLWGVFPNLKKPLMILVFSKLALLILFESFLSFIGIGLKPPAVSLGYLLNEGWNSMYTHPHLIIFPGLIFILLAFSLNYLLDEFKH